MQQKTQLLDQSLTKRNTFPTLPLQSHPSHMHINTQTHICTQNTLTENKAQNLYKSHDNTNINQNLQKVLKT